MPSLFSIFVDLKANVADFVSGMSSSSYAAKRAGREISDAFSSLGGLAEKALAPLGEVGQAIGGSLSSIAETAGAAAEGLSALSSVSVLSVLGGVAGTAIAAGAALGALAIKGSEVVENFQRISEKTGISISDLQTFGAAGETVGVSLEDIVTGMRKFDEVLTGSVPGAKTLQATMKGLGITAQDNRGALLQLADAFSAMPDGPRKSAIAVELLGRSGLNLIPILDKGREGILEFEAIVDEFGPQITSRAIAANEQWKTSTLELSEAWKKTEVDFEKAILPIFSWLSEKIAVSISEWDKWAEAITRAERDAAASPLAAQGIAEIPGPSALPIVGQNQSTNAEGIARAQASIAQAAIDSQKGSYKSLYELIAAGDAKHLELEHQKENLAVAIALQDYKQAAAIEKRINALKVEISIDQQREKLLEKINELTFKHPTLAKRPSFAGPTSEQISALPNFSELQGVSPQQLAANQRVSKQMADVAAAANAGQEAVKDFWSTYGNDASNTYGQIEELETTEYAKFYDLLQQKEISQQQFNDISLQLEKNRIEAIADLYAAQQEQRKKLDQATIDNPYAGLADKFRAMASEIQLEGQNLGPKIFSSMSKATDELESQLAQLVVTGKSNFKSLFQSLEESLAKAGFQSIFGSLAGLFTGKGQSNAPGGTPGIFSGSLGLGSLGNIFGLGGSGAKGTGPDGSQGEPFYVVSASPAGAAAGAAANPLGSVLGYAGGSGEGGGGFGFGGLISGFATMFGGGLATGGDMQPGKAYLVGEKGPELMFAGKRGGTVAPIAARNGGNTIQQHFHIETPNADSFLRSSSQVMASTHRAAQTALQRNG